MRDKAVQETQKRDAWGKKAPIRMTEQWNACDHAEALDEVISYEDSQRPQLGSWV